MTGDLRRNRSGGGHGTICVHRHDLVRSLVSNQITSVVRDTSLVPRLISQTHCVRVWYKK